MNVLLLSMDCVEVSQGASTSTAQFCSVVFSGLSDTLGVSISRCDSGVSDLANVSDIDDTIDSSSLVFVLCSSLVLLRETGSSTRSFSVDD